MCSSRPSSFRFVFPPIQFSYYFVSIKRGLSGHAPGVISTRFAGRVPVCSLQVTAQRRRMTWPKNNRSFFAGLLLIALSILGCSNTSSPRSRILMLDVDTRVGAGHLLPHSNPPVTVRRIVASSPTSQPFFGSCPVKNITL